VTLRDGRRANYGFGWFIGELGGRKTVNHGGGVFGYVNHTIYIPEERLYVALLANCVDPQANPPTHVTAESVAAALLGGSGAAPASKTIELSETELARYAGTYKLGDSQTRRVTVEAGKLWYEAAPGRNIEIVPESRIKFVARGFSAHVTFDFNEKGDVTRLVIHQASGRTIEAMKQ
jgi:CubicO group peptidase (beta-lactamase class C family)